MERKLYEEGRELFRDAAREFNHREVAPHYGQWEQDHLMDRKVWTAAGKDAAK